jgi:hypothetical protein
VLPANNAGIMRLLCGSGYTKAADVAEIAGAAKIMGKKIPQSIKQRL